MATNSEPAPLKNPEQLKLSSPETKEFWKVNILFEDEHFLALDKPTDLPVIPIPDSPSRGSLSAVIQKDIERNAPWAESRGIKFLRVTHYLEPNIGGALLLAKSEEAFAKMKDLFGVERPLQSFTALTRGRPPEDEFDVLCKMAPHQDRPDYMTVSRNKGKRARTLIQVTERFRDYVLLNCQPLTQRPHQVRAHLRYIRLPLIADRVYGASPLYLSRIKPDYRLKKDQKERPLITRPALHATRLAFDHPFTGEAIEIESPWARDLAICIKYLRRYWLPVEESSTDLY